MPGQVHFRIRIQHGVADGPNALTGENEILYLIGRCAAGIIAQMHQVDDAQLIGSMNKYN